jgi:polyhydroxyalkanoate synthesis regulator phasin
VPVPLPADLVDHLVRTTDLTPAEAARVVADVLAYYDEAPREWVRRRHGELRRQGLTNDAIFERIGRELPEHRFRGEARSARQLRRVVYG